jgi:iron complex transport system substrate-binding protein
MGQKPRTEPDEGRKPRVATFLASATELVCALGMRDRLVGVSHECDFPLSRPPHDDIGGTVGIETLPRLTRSRISAPNCRAIHGEVERLVTQALALYEVDLDALRAASPDILITQDLCGVCAVSLEDVRRAASTVLDKDVTVLSLAPKRLDDVWQDLVRVGEALSLGMTAQAIANGFRSRIARTAKRLEGRARPTVLALEWLDPAMVGGLWMPELIALAGGEPLVGKTGEMGVVLSDDDVPAEGPDVVLLKPCGYPLSQTLAETATIAALRARWPHARWFAADGNAYFNRSGPRLVESLEILAACLHPEVVPDLVARHAGAFVAL